MFRLLKLLSNFRNTLLFLVLELLAFIFIIRHNDHQRHVMGNAMLETSAKIHQQQNRVLSYLHLPEQNDSLVERTKELQEQYDELERRLREYANLKILNQDSNALSAIRIDTLVSAEEFEYIPGHAIRHSVDQNYNQIVIDKGSDHGIRPGMGVVSPQGIAGRVVRVRPNFSLALSALNVSFKLSVKSESTDYIGGIYEWENGDPEHGYLTKIPPDEGGNINIGDKIVTAGVSTVFPAGYLVGHVVAKDNSAQDGLYSLKIKLATDFNRLYNLFVINPLHKSEIDSLENNLSANQ